MAVYWNNYPPSTGTSATTTYTTAGPIRAKKGDILIFKVNRPVDEHFTAWAKTASDQMKDLGITAVFLSDKVDLYAKVEVAG